MRKIKGYGFIPSPPDRRNFKFKVSPPVILPKAVDLSQNLHLPILNQGNLGSCTANSTVEAIAYDEGKQNLQVILNSRLFIYYVSRFWGGGEDGTSIDSGCSLYDVFHALNTYGYLPETDWPYDISKFAVKPPDFDFQKALPSKKVIYSQLDQRAQSIMSTLASGFPIVLGMTIYDSFESDLVAHTGIYDTPKQEEGAVGGHALIAVGYDQGITFPSGARGGVLIRNSWGAGWGLNGHFWCPIDLLTDTDVTNEMWVLQSVTS